MSDAHAVPAPVRITFGWTVLMGARECQPVSPDYTALPTATPQCHRGAITESAANGRDYDHILCLFRQVHEEGRRGFCLSNLGTTEAALQVQEDDQSFLPMSLVVSRCTTTKPQ